MKQTKKSVLGLNTIKAFIVVLLSLAIIGIVTMIVLSAITNVGVVPQVLGTTYNETNSATQGAWINGTPYTFKSYSNGTVRNVKNCAVIEALNRTLGVNTVITTGNYTVDATSCTITNKTSAVWLNVSITYSYTYDGYVQDQISTINGNTSAGITSFFANSSTYFALLGVVVIILIISLVVVVVNRFGGDNSGGGSQANPSI